MHGKKRLGWLKPFSKLQKLWRNRRRANGIRVGYFPRIQYVAAQSRSSRVTVEIRWDSRNFHRKNHIYVDVQRHLMGIKRQWTRMPGEWQTRFSVRKKIWKRTMVIYWSWFWKEVVLYQWRQSTRNLGPYRGKDAGGIRRKWLSNFPCYEPIVVQRSTQKQRTWKTVDTLSSRIGNDWDYFSHNCLCKSAQSLRSNRGDMWRVWNPSWKNGETRCDGAIKFLTRAKCDQDRSTFGLWWPGQPRSSIAAKWRTNWTAVTTRQIEQILYGRRISECCWNWTLLQDERHCRSLTISCSGLSWTHSSKRRRSITTKRIDPREHQDWARARSCNQLLAWLVWGWDQNLVFEQRQYSLLGQNFSWIK